MLAVRLIPIASPLRNRFSVFAKTSQAITTLRRPMQSDWSRGAGPVTLQPAAEWIFLWLALSAVVGVAANSHGRNGVGWFLLALVISPLIAGLLLLALPGKGRRLGRKRF